MRHTFNILCVIVLISAPIWVVYGLGAFLTLDLLWFARSFDARIGLLFSIILVYVFCLGFAGSL